MEAYSSPTYGSIYVEPVKGRCSEIYDQPGAAYCWIPEIGAVAFPLNWSQRRAFCQEGWVLMAKRSVYYTNLVLRVMDQSVETDWGSAVMEWSIVDCEEDESLLSSCICGHPELRYLFTIQNTCNRNRLYPIGSVCIKKFDRADLNEEADIREQLFKVMHAVEANTYISLSTEFFSRKLLRFLYEHEAFKASPHNGFDPAADYKFLLKMFNKRNEDSITRAQWGKISAIVLASIKPYLQGLMREVSAAE